MTWKEDVEAALEQLLGTITIPMQASSLTQESYRQVPSRS